jgi:alkyl sulfatase BDS1-like metallo-beta-lactamase superfamily hydrolase
VLGVTTQADVDAGKVAIIAPEHFTDHAVQENVYAGTAMARRASYMYGAVLARGPQGQVGCGLGQVPSAGEVALIVPTVDIRATGETHTVDGVEIEFQMAPGTEAPAEMHFYFPRFRALCMAENATHNLHNLLTLRGALVRDPHGWAATSPRPSTPSPTAPTSCSRPTTGRPGARSRLSNSFRCKGICTPICTTRHCDS